MRGTNKMKVSELSVDDGSPPLARDKYNLTNYQCVGYGITPACAGQIAHFRWHLNLDWDHPRLRGTNQKKLEQIQEYLGSPPLARDKFLFTSSFCCICGITPACAGQIQGLILYLLLMADHPRLRGTNCHCITAIRSCVGSPPLARDKLQTLRRGLAFLRDHPRLRGTN